MSDINDQEVMDLSTWEQKLNELAAEDTDSQIRLPRKLNGKRVNREEIAHAMVTSFEMIGGLPRLAYWADANYSEFMKIFGRMLPKETLQVHDGEVIIRHAVAPTQLDADDGDTTGSKGRVLTFPQELPEGQ